jgi:DNA-binding NtrC family response regulator
MKILIIEDEEKQRSLLKDLLEKEGYETEGSADGNSGIERYRHADFDLILLDQRLPDMPGIEVIKKMKDVDPLTPIIMLTAYGNIQDAVAAMREGATHYLTKPVNVDELLVVIRKALDDVRLRRENAELQRELGERYSGTEVVFASKKMAEVMALARSAATSDAHVLITGESGTGKEVVAQAIHNLSSRKSRLLVPVHLTAMPETLVEAELFGYERGAFTGADRRRIGKFEFAGLGTIFLDEIGELSMGIQVKLLRVLQDKKIYRLGRNEEVRVDVRIIAATNKDLENEVRSGRFREDLYYRLNVIRIHLPPLRERKDDIPVLAEHFLRSFATRNHKPIKGFDRDAMRSLVRYPFPGNVRELENIIERAVIFSRSEYIAARDLPDLAAPSAIELPKGGLNEAVSRMEKQSIIEALKRNQGNQSQAAEDLGLSERVLRYKIHKYSIRDQLD